MSRIFQTFLKNENAIRRIFRRYFHSQEDVEDLTQEVFMKCFAAEMKSEIHEPKSFLLRSAKNVAISELRKKVRTTTDSIENVGGADVFIDERTMTAEDIVNSKRKLALLTRAMAELPPHYQRAFWLRKIEGLKLHQIAARLNISQSTAKKYVVEALFLCEKSMRKQGYQISEFRAENRQPIKAHVRISPSVANENCKQEDG